MSKPLQCRIINDLINFEGGVKMKSKKLSYNKILVLFCIILVSVLMTGCQFPPNVLNFSASPSTINPGDSSTLTWSVSDAVHVYILPGVGGVESSGSTSVSPAITTVYTLTASNDMGVSVTAEVTVNVTVIPLNELYGSIYINSTPSGANVYLDGKDTGETTPTTLTAVEVGEHTIKLIYFHYQAWQTNLNI
jgi:hypothetical protein